LQREHPLGKLHKAGAPASGSCSESAPRFGLRKNRLRGRQTLSYRTMTSFSGWSPRAPDLVCSSAEIDHIASTGRLAGPKKGDERAQWWKSRGLHWAFQGKHASSGRFCGLGA
jgi:hypothetical protein